MIKDALVQARECRIAFMFLCSAGVQLALVAVTPPVWSAIAYDLAAWMAAAAFGIYLLQAAVTEAATSSRY
ncbi:MAG: hypothetical protein KDJ18_01845 [Hyphomicrobiaceae bacterium]|nr:hypothetical protein [Hyphomicrobiaceae bacterium]